MLVSFTTYNKLNTFSTVLESIIRSPKKNFIQNKIWLVRLHLRTERQHRQTLLRGPSRSCMFGGWENIILGQFDQTLTLSVWLMWIMPIACLQVGGRVIIYTHALVMSHPLIHPPIHVWKVCSCGLTRMCGDERAVLLYKVQFVLTNLTTVKQTTTQLV